MDLSTMIVVTLVIVLLIGLSYLAFAKVEEVRPPEDVAREEEAAAAAAVNAVEPASDQPKRLTREERVLQREARARRRARRLRQEAAAAAAAGGVPPVTETAADTASGGLTDAATIAVEDVIAPIFGLDTPPSEAAAEAMLAAPAEPVSIEKPEPPEPAAPPVPSSAETPAPATPAPYESDAMPSADVLAAVPSPDPMPVEGPDDLTRIKGLGPRAAAQLNTLGVTRFQEMADWTPEQATDIDVRMGSFQGRMARDRWIEQASYLARGDLAGFETKFGNLG